MGALCVPFDRFWRIAFPHYKRSSLMKVLLYERMMQVIADLPEEQRAQIGGIPVPKELSNGIEAQTESSGIAEVEAAVIDTPAPTARSGRRKPATATGRKSKPGKTVARGRKPGSDTKPAPGKKGSKARTNRVIAAAERAIKRAKRGQPPGSGKRGADAGSGKPRSKRRGKRDR
jgi:hypothetical protein